MKRITLFLVFCFLFLSIKINAQHPIFHHLTDKEGLPDIEFYDIIEDSKGFIWLAANKGLFRYDGKTFKNYTHQKKRGLSVFGLKLDSKGRIWCNNISGQFFFIENDELSLFLDIGHETNGIITSFAFHQNKILINTMKGIYTYAIDNPSELREFNKGVLIKNKRKTDTLYIYRDYKIFRTTKNSSPKIIYNLDGYKDFRFNKWSIHSYEKKNLIYAYNVVNSKIKPKLFYEINDKLKEIKLPKIFDNNEIINIYEVNNQIWLCTYLGVYTYTIKNEKLKHINTYFIGKDVGGLLKDRDDNYWFVSLRNGIYIIPNLYIEKYDIPEEKSNISALSKIDKDALFLGSVKGDLAILNIKKSKLNFIKNKYTKKIYDIGQNKEKVFLSLNNYSLIYDKKKKELVRDDFLRNAKDFVVIDNNYILNALHDAARVTNINNKKSKILRRTRAYTTHYSKNKEMFVGYVDGVEKHSENNESTKIKFKNQPIIAIDIDETNNGIIWISTLKDGIIGLKNNEPVINYTTKNGLLSNQAGKIKGDGNYLWVTTDKGLQLLNSETGKFKNLTQKDGLNSFNISEIIPFEKHIYFSSNKGLFKINKEKVFLDRKILDFYFTSILINDEKVTEKVNYELKSNEKKIKINFQTNGFLGDSDITYKYKLLDGSDKPKWNTIEKGINQVTFNNLAPGNYNITLKAIKLNQQQQSLEKTITLKINAPFYRQIWFVFLVPILIFGLFWLIILKSIRKKERKQKQAIEKERMQKELITSKLETLQSQMNPHFTFNALNSIQNLVLKGEKQKAYNYLTKFSSLLRENLILSTKSFVYFDEELSIIKKYLELENLRFKDGFSYKIIGSESIDNVKIPTMIIQPFIENAINHGLLHKTDGVGIINIEFILEDTLNCIIIDNGIGIKAATIINDKRNKTKKSFSTKSISSKLKILKDYYKTDIGFKYEDVNNGTKVIIKIPYTFSDD
ncbi:histidine kinase [Polaribacter vadi]|uniref:sensor histidine kinase n=1 Tax=Polaribacter TaxID=52959 RepID=UPI001C09B69A|nr:MULTISPECIES: sensor histidine kinase [Polaribacter]MBU3012791.1 histidine kinase [Polaribacter vadi]MDO6742607.1 histidine kinase [Polaribacter sp. 1_MG-2023]